MLFAQRSLTIYNGIHALLITLIAKSKRQTAHVLNEVHRIKISHELLLIML